MLRRVALTRATQRNIPEDAILHSYRCVNLKSYIKIITYCNIRLDIFISGFIVAHLTGIVFIFS
jgi:hypothetical protein